MEAKVQRSLAKGGRWKYKFFFHKMVNSHRRRNFIKKIKIIGIWIEEEATIRREGGRCL